MKAFIFDFDGVIADSVYAHFAAERDILKRFGIHFSLDQYKNEYTGMPVRQIFDKILKIHNKTANLDEIVREKILAVESNANEVKPIDGIQEILRFLKEKGYHIGLASGANRSFVNIVLKNLNLENYFEAVLTLEDSSKGKPDPDIFLKAATVLGFPPSECVVVEDGVLGMQAAKNAKMKCIGLVSDNNEYPCDFTIHRLLEIKHRINEL